MIGKTISHYRIVEKIGQGGMGEVYLADDTTLDRKVALKFLPEAFISDPERMARFEREAKLLASLNHPNIAGIYGLEQADGNRFLVLEYVEGETLQARLSKGALPLEDALALCRQIAEGLEAAHEKGVIHRDLKPANVMITAEENVKILDFGLAKALSDETQIIDSSQSPTLTEAMTRPGVILGTAAYMSPEQAKGKSVDKRADIWAFGCILYECLTGKKAFKGETVTETLAAVIKGEPDWNRLPTNLHARMRCIIERCLEKDSKNRYRDIGDTKLDIREVKFDQIEAVDGTASDGKNLTNFRTLVLWIAASAILAAAIAGLVVWEIRSPDPLQIVRLSYELPEGKISDYYERAIAISPDGRLVAYNTDSGIFLRYMDALGSKLLPGTEGFFQRPFFSPDSSQLGFYSSKDSRLKKIAISGESIMAIAELSSQPHGSFLWDEKDTIVFCQGNRIMRVSALGGNEEVIIESVNEQMVHPQILPDGKTILFTRLPIPTTVMVQSLESGVRKELFSGDSARYLPTGHIIYTAGNDLFAVSFDVDALEVTSESVLMVEGIFRTGAPQLDVSESGTLIYLEGTSSSLPDTTLVWVDRQGNEEELMAGQRSYRNLKLSPDGKQVALQLLEEKGRDICVWDFNRKNMTNLTADTASDTVPIWTNDGQKVAFASNSEGDSKIFLKAADGSGKKELLGSVAGQQILPACWSKDGKHLVLTVQGDSDSGINHDIAILSINEEGVYSPLLHEKYIECQPQISPDGQWMAYTTNESGQYEVYVCPFPEVESPGKKKVSTNGGHSPLWSPDNKELFYRGNDKIMAVPVKTDSTLILGTPKELFNELYVSPILNDPIGGGAHQFYFWDIHPDSKKFLMIKPAGISAVDSTTEVPRKINVVLNWFEELKERVPTD